MSRMTKKIPSCAECQNNTKIICALSASEKDDLSDNKSSNFYKKGQIVFYEGSQSHGLFCIYSGKVKLSKLGENGKEQVVRFAKTGDILGYRSIFSEEPYQSSATVIEDSYICQFSKDKFMSIMKTNPQLSRNTITLLSNDLKQAEKSLLSIAQKTVKERIAEALLLLHSTFGYFNDSTTLDVVLSRSEIADTAGTTTETTIRTLALLNKEGFIVLEGKSISIPDINKLSRVAGIFD